MGKDSGERRQYVRYETEMKVYVRASYDLKTKVVFRVLNINKQRYSFRRQAGLTKNISVEGLRFSSKRQLNQGDKLLLEIYVPKQKVPVKMEGEVRWSRKLPEEADGKGLFHTGVKLISVGGVSVAESIHYDEEYKVVWSEVLESVFGSFIAMVKELSNKDKKKKNDNK